MKNYILLILILSCTTFVFAQDPSDNKISRKTVDALPNEYPDGVYLMDSESDPSWSWPEDAGVVLGLKWATSNSRHSQILVDRYGRKMMIRGKNWGNDAWTAWNRILVEYNGQIGVGTTSPLANLDVRTSGKSGVIASFLSDESISVSSEEHKWTIRTGRSFDYPNRTLDFGMVSDSYGQNPAFYVAPKSIEVFRITEEGKVGIGTASPGANLHIQGGNVGNGNVMASILIGKHNGPEIQTIQQSSDEDVQGLAFRVKSSATAANPSFEAMRINSNGNIGIGTISTGTHKLAVEGTIGAREIKVEATGWSDFVFERDYELRTLEDVEKHINENGHLPEIPSEAEVTENGINLGEMDAKLLMKIEELTLYMIEINKQLKSQSERVQQLERENSELEEKISRIENE